MRKFRIFLLVPVKLICMLSHAGEGKEYIHFLSCWVTRMPEEEFSLKELVLLRWEGWFHAVTFPWCSSWIESLISPGRCCFSESLKSVSFPPLHFQWDFQITISQGGFLRPESCCSGSLGWCSQLTAVSGGQDGAWNRSREEELRYAVHDVISK